MVVDGAKAAKFQLTSISPMKNPSDESALQNYFEPKQDEYFLTRGATCSVLFLHCNKCDRRLFKYQKDGPGPLKRLYNDRIIECDRALRSEMNKHTLFCCCGAEIGIDLVYEKENRDAIRLFVEAVSIKIVAPEECENE